MKRAYEQRPEAVQAWLNGDVRRFRDGAHSRRGAEIQWGDETGCARTMYAGSSYAQIGKTPTAAWQVDAKVCQ
ncbi:MAG: hypothetical protein E5299_01882 [Burkholderia gladioli]|nr:MAG: hypothetical protein E5299_01882 [Burkholderia gladioli]